MNFKTLVTQLLTSSDNQTFSFSKMLVALPASFVGIYKFAIEAHPDFQAFGIFVGAMIAALAVKAVTDK